MQSRATFCREGVISNGPKTLCRLLLPLVLKTCEQLQPGFRTSSIFVDNELVQHVERRWLQPGDLAVRFDDLPSDSQLLTFEARCVGCWV